MSSQKKYIVVRIPLRSTPPVPTLYLHLIPSFTFRAVLPHDERKTRLGTSAVSHLAHRLLRTSSALLRILFDSLDSSNVCVCLDPIKVDAHKSQLQGKFTLTIRLGTILITRDKGDCAQCTIPSLDQSLRVPKASFGLSARFIAKPSQRVVLADGLVTGRK